MRAAAGPQADGGDEHPGLTPELAQKWSSVAARELHWFRRAASGEHDAWLSRSTVQSERWSGWTAETLQPIELQTWRAWEAVLDASEAPFVRWFSGGLTNAAFNECDRHVLCDRGAETAFVSETNSSACTSSGVFGELRDTMTRHDVLLRAVVAACALRSQLGLRPLGRLALLLPNELEVCRPVAVPPIDRSMFCCARCKPGTSA
eukprot:1616259-Prymnesium_polylepis.1